MNELVLCDRQQVQTVDLKLLRRIVRWLLTGLLRVGHYQIGVHLVGAVKMARINATFLGHEGSTDVIAFDHIDKATLASGTSANVSPRSLHTRNISLSLHGEIFICLDETVAQARRFRTTWQAELTRYLVHGLLHLHGYDDSNTTARREMKRVENRLLHELARRFPLSKLARKPRVRP